MLLELLDPEDVAEADAAFVVDVAADDIDDACAEDVGATYAEDDVVGVLLAFSMNSAAWTELGAATDDGVADAIEAAGVSTGATEAIDETWPLTRTYFPEAIPASTSDPLIGTPLSTKTVSMAPGTFTVATASRPSTGEPRRSWWW